MVPIVITESGQVEGFSCSRSPSVPAACLSSLHCCWQQSAAGHKTLSQVPGKFFSHEQCLPYDMSVQHPQTKWCCVIVGSSGGFKKLQNSNSEGRVAAASWRQPQSEEMKKKKKNNMIKIPHNSPSHTSEAWLAPSGRTCPAQVPQSPSCSSSRTLSCGGAERCKERGKDAQWHRWCL